MGNVGFVIPGLGIPGFVIAGLEQTGLGLAANGFTDFDGLAFLADGLRGLACSNDTPAPGNTNVATRHNTNN